MISTPRLFLARRDRFGLWLSLVERLPRVQEAAGSNPASPIVVDSDTQQRVPLILKQSRPLGVARLC